MRKLLYQPLVVAIITLLVIVLCTSLYISTLQLRGSAQKVAVLRADVAKQQAATDELAQKLGEAQRPVTQEKIIRDELLMQKPGEYVVQMPDLPVPLVAVAGVPKKLSPWQAWKKLLF